VASCNKVSAGGGTGSSIKFCTTLFLPGSTGTLGRLTYFSGLPAWNSSGVNVTVPSGRIRPMACGSDEDMGTEDGPSVVGMDSLEVKMKV